MIADCDMPYCDLWKGTLRGAIEDGFIRQAKNADYALNPDEEFSDVLVRFLPSMVSPGLETAWSFSSEGSLEGCHGYAFTFSGWRVYLKVDAKPFPQQIQAGMLQAGRPLFALALPFDGSLADVEMRRAAQAISRREEERAVRNATARIERAAGKISE
jgi:L-ascorbate metabolism protein UlaG (beta-lactamase superfamily)